MPSIFGNTSFVYLFIVVCLAFVLGVRGDGYEYETSTDGETVDTVDDGDQTETAHDDDSFDPIAIVVTVIVFILGAPLWVVLRFFVFGHALSDDADAATDIHIQTNKAIDEQQAAFQAGTPEAQSRAEHERNMAKLRKFLGPEEAKKLEKELDAQGVELDSKTVDKAIKQGSTDIPKIMVKHRCGFSEAVRISMQQQARKALEEDPDLMEKLKSDENYRKQALELGVITASKLEKLKSKETTSTGTKENSKEKSKSKEK